MAGLESTVARLARLRRLFGHPPQFPGAPMPPGSGLREVLGFGRNPGNLRMYVHRPERLRPNPALVVALHGCGQSAGVFEHGTGWSQLADWQGFVVVYPEQQPANNTHGCFNWFVPAKSARDEGEALSIREMVEHAARVHGIDRRRVFVTGLSAGGAMTANLLATYPDVFTGGSIIAGLASGAAGTLQEALERMAQGIPSPGSTLGDRVRRASPHKGPWPRVSIWHGSADAVVAPANAEATLAQWLDVHGIAARPPREQILDGCPRRVWRDAAGEPLVEVVAVGGMGHGVPLAIAGKAAPTGHAGPFFLDVGISATDHSARFFGLIDDAVPARAARQTKPASPPPGADVGSIMDAALKAAGLSRNR